MRKITTPVYKAMKKRKAAHRAAFLFTVLLCFLGVDFFLKLVEIDPALRFFLQGCFQGGLLLLQLLELDIVAAAGCLLGLQSAICCSRASSSPSMRSNSSCSL